MTSASRDLYISRAPLYWSLLLPGLGHLIQGRWRRALFVGLLLVPLIGTLYAAVARGRLAWLAHHASETPGEFWFSTLMLFVLFGLVWFFAFLDLLRYRNRLLTPEEFRGQGYWEIVARRFAKDLKGIVGLSLILVAVMVALFAPFYARGNGLSMDLVAFLGPPSAQHPLGQDNYGRDVLDRLIFGARVALGIGAVATLMNIVFGGFLGLVGGYFRGAVDAIIMRALEIINSIPFLVLVLLIVSLWGSNVLQMILILGIFGLQPARIIRSEVLSVREEDYVLAARAIG
ncbi:MAG: ABC transporter permease, partial [Candidatus Bipolaricaulota bacterium]